MAFVDELVVALGFDYRGEGEARRFQQDLDRAARSTQGFMDKIGRFAAVAGAALGGLAIGNKLGDFIGDITNTGAAFEEMGVRLKALEGSSEGAEKALAWITDFATRTPLELAEVVDSYALMRTYGLDPTSGALQAVTDSMAATGGGAAKLNGVITGLGQAWTKQKLQGEEIMQLLERGIPVWDMLAKATGKSVPELQKLSSAGKLGRKEIALLIDQIGAKYQGASEEYAKTFAGITSNLRDNWTKFLKGIADAGYFDAVKSRLQGLLDWVNSRWGDGTFDRWATNISDGLIGAMNTVSHIATQVWRIGSAAYYTADAIVSLTSKITGLSKAWSAAGLGVGLMATRAGGRAMLLALARRIPQLAAALLIEDVISGLNGDKSLIGGLKGGQDALDAVKRNFEDMQVAAEGLAETLNGVFGFDKMEGQTQLDALMAGIKDFAKGEYVKAVNDLALAIQAVADNLRAISDALQNPEAAFERFADAAIAQMDRVLAFIDGRLGGALTLLRLRAADEGEIVGPDGTVFKNGGVGEKQSRKPITWDNSLAGKFFGGEPEDEPTSHVSGAFDLTRGTGQPSVRPSNMLELEGSIFSTIRMLPTIIGDAISRANGNTSQSNVDAFQRFIQGMQKTQEMISGQSVNMPMSAVDNRNQSVNVGAPQVTVNVTQPTAAPAAVGAAVGRAIGQAVQTRPQVAQAAAQ